MSKLLNHSEMEKLNKLLKEHILEDTFDSWVSMRIHGLSASLAVEGNVSTSLLKVFDKVKNIVLEKEK